MIGIIRGTDPGAGVVIVGAHFDHLAPKRRGEDKIYNGADDNASGTAGMLAIARALVPMGAQLRSSVLFIAFNGEEAGLKGSRQFVRHPPVPLDSIRGLFNMDMISRGEENVIFIDGAEQSQDVIRVLRTANEEIGLDLRIDTHPDWLRRSDQWPFLRKGVQAVLFSVEDHEDYHEVTDHADRIIASLAAKVSKLVALAVLDLAGEERVGSPSPGEPPDTRRKPKSDDELPRPDRLTTYIPVAVVLVMALLFVGGNLLMSHMIGPHEEGATKAIAYESGMNSDPDPRASGSMFASTSWR